MNISRRSLLLGALSMTQASLLSRFGLGSARANSLRTATKLLTIYIPGGWMPSLLWCPFSNAAITKQVKALATANDGPGNAGLYYDATRTVLPATMQTGVDPGPGSIKQQVRVPMLWNPGNPADNTNPNYNSNGYSWVQNKLHENLCVIHGIDQGTAAHESGRISAMCGAAGAEYRAPAMQAVVANAIFGLLGDKRPLPSVSLSEQVLPVPLDLGAAAAPTVLQDAGSLRNFISQDNNSTWNGFRNRTAKPVPSFAGDATETVGVNPLDEYTLAQTAALKGRSTSGTDSFYEKIYNSMKGTSKLLAADVTTTLSKTPGLANTVNPYPVYSSHGVTYVEEYGASWIPQFDLALKLLRSDLCTSISLSAPGPGRFFFDTHGESFYNHMNKLYVLYEVLGKFLGEMKSSGLFSNTLVVIFSEFSRTFSANGHWPTTSVAMLGAGVTPNTMIGNYDVEGKPALTDPIGLPVPLIDESNLAINRIPKSSDVCATVYDIMGVDKFFIPGGYGKIVGVGTG